LVHINRSNFYCAPTVTATSLQLISLDDYCRIDRIKVRDVQQVIAQNQKNTENKKKNVKRVQSFLQWFELCAAFFDE